jgi:F-type H+-transporting ATPase subunit b
VKFSRRFLAFASSVFLILFFTALPMLAEESAKPDPADSPAGMVFRWLNFLIVFGAIAFLIAKHGGAFFKGNAKTIAANIREATAVKEEAESELRSVEVKIARLNQDVTEMREEAARNWAEESERLRASGAAEIEKINLAARAELAASERAAQQELRESAAAMAVDRAAALVSSMMNTETRARMFQSFLNELGKGAK